jgi:phosphohistidine phosphatase
MKKLYIVRHAKSDWSNPALNDFERTLNKRGLHDAPLMGERFKKLGFIPDMVFSSSANRAVMTCNIICKNLGYEPQKVEMKKELYLAAPQTILKMINTFQNVWKSVMLFGHNPGFTELIELLCQKSVGNLPTCALAAAHFKIDDWKSVHWASGSLAAFEYPKKYS